MKAKILQPLTLCLTALIAIPAAYSAPQADSKESQSQSASEVTTLKNQLSEQQKQIDQLKQALEEQRKLIEQSLKANAANGKTSPDFALPRDKALGDVASTTPIIPPAPPVAPSLSSTPSLSTAPLGNAAQPVGETSPLQLKIGDAYITPVGFLDMTSVTRSTNPGTGIGTNFGSIPYSNTQAGSLSESRLSPQNSRIGARIDTGFGDYKVMGYWESDFLGQIANPPNGSLAVSSNPYVFRLRLYWADVRKGNWEFLAGQSWSLMTPGRTGISPLPADIFYTQNMDVNYQAGLVWGRIPGFRGVYHFSDKVAFALALENSEPYVGGANGGSAVVLPALVGSANSVSGAVLGGQINNGSSTISSASLHPDIIAKLAFDPTSKFHFELAGVEITDKFSNPASSPAFATNTKLGGGGAVNLSYELFKGFRLLTNNYWSYGGGRYIFGQAPDFIIGGNGTISLVHSASTVTGFESTFGRYQLFGYYGGVYIPKDLAIDANGKTLIGYGPIANDGQNRAIQEVTFGSNVTLAKNPKWGALNLIFQYSYVQRNPWLFTGTSPSNANLSMGFFDFRYTLPGSAPTMGK